MQWKYKLYPSYREHCGGIQDPDGHIITESYNVSYFPSRKFIVFLSFVKHRPVFELLLSNPPQLLLFVSEEINLDVTVGNQGNKAVAEQSYAESEEDYYLRLG